MKIHRKLVYLVAFFSVGFAVSAQEDLKKMATAEEISAKKETKEYKKQLNNLTKGMATTASGLQYIVTEKTAGVQAKNGDIVKVHYTGKLVGGIKFDSSLDREQPLSLLLGVGMVIKGWDEGIALLKVGEKATFVIPGDLAYAEGGSGVLIGPNETLVFDVELLEIAATEPFDTAGIKENVTESGLKYYVLKSNSKGEKSVIGKPVLVSYSGYFEDGKKFDTSWNPRKYFQPLKFVLGQGQVIKGWDEAVALMRVGERMRFVVPANLAYGEKGYPGAIPPNSTLIFDIELVDVPE